MAERMDDEELASLIDTEIHQSVGYYQGKLAEDRRKALAYYYGEPFGNEVEGRSQVVSQDVSDTVEWILPSLLKIFTSSEDIVRCDPTKPGDEQQAAQATDYANWVFWRQNPGFVILYTWFKDALLQKNGFIKVYWEDYTKRHQETYQGLTSMEMVMLAQDLGSQGMTVDIKKHESYLGDDGEKRHDLTLEIRKEAGKTCVDPIPPEELLVNRKAPLDLDKCRFVAHQTKRTKSDLEEMGFDTSDIEDWQDGEYSLERVERFQQEEDTSYSNPDTTDESMKEYWLVEAYPLVDFDGDGIAERRIVHKIGNKILKYKDGSSANIEIDRVPIIPLTPIIMPHKLWGRSVADLVMDLQLIKSTVFRQVLDNMYLTNNSRMMALEGMVNIDDLLTVRPGGVVRVKAFDAVKPLQAPPLGAPAFQLLGYIDSVRENRTGVRYFQGVDPDVLNKNVAGVAIDKAAQASQIKIELIARIFAETGVKDLFWAILELESKHRNQAQMVQLRGQWVPVDPREWSNRFDMTVSVGLGMGSQDQAAAHAMGVLQVQQGLAQAGLAGLVVQPQNAYEAALAYAKAGDPKNAEKYFTDPQGQQPQQPPNVDLLKIQAAMQKAAMQDKTKRDTKAIDFLMQTQQLQHQGATQATQMQNDAQQSDIQRFHDANMKGMELRNQQDIQNAQQAHEGGMAAIQHSHDANMQASQQAMQVNESQNQRFHDANMQSANQGHQMNMQKDSQESAAKIEADKKKPDTSLLHAVTQLNDGQKQIAEAVAEMTKTLKAPKKVITDENGEPIGVELA